MCFYYISRMEDSMKKKVVFLFFLISIIVTAACNDEKEITDPVIGGKGDEGIEDTVIYLNHFISGEFYGDSNGNGTNFISMVLSDGLDWNREQEGYTKNGKYVLLEINSKMRSDYMPEVGTYKPVSLVGSLVGTFNPGELICSDGPCYAVSTYLSEVDREGHEIFTALTTGKIVISKNEDEVYSIVMDMEDEDDNPVHVVYEGKLPLIFVGYKYEPQQVSELNLVLEEVVRTEYWGDFFKNGTSDILLDFTTSDGKYGVGLELFCPPGDRTSITTGSYTFSMEEKEMTAKPGYFNPYGTLYPSYAFKLGKAEYESIWWLSLGKVDVNRSDDGKYRIEVDGYSYFGSHIKAVYDGELTISDATIAPVMKVRALNRMETKSNSVLK